MCTDISEFRALIFTSLQESEIQHYLGLSGSSKMDPVVLQTFNRMMAKGLNETYVLRSIQNLFSHPVLKYKPPERVRAMVAALIEIAQEVQ